MLTLLRIENLAIIERLELEFGQGLHALTGETGAGKSIIAGALGLVLGDRATSDSIRHGVDSGLVEALFNIKERPDVQDQLRSFGLPEADDELLVRRVLSRSGRSRVFINGSLATLQCLSSITGPLVDMSRQHEQYSLINPNNQLGILDAFAGLEVALESYAADYRVLLALRRELDNLQADESERERRRDYLSFQVEEIDSAELEPGEDRTLGESLQRQRHAQELCVTAAEVIELLYERRDSAAALISRAREKLTRLADLDQTMAPLAGRLEAARIEVEDISYELRSYGEGLTADPQRLAELEERHELLKGLIRKHGPSVDAVLARRQELASELASLETADERRDELSERIRDHETKVLAAAREISACRRRAAAKLEGNVQETLKALAMGRCRLRVAFQDGPTGPEALGERGLDRIEMRVATNVGEGYSPLSRVASGGELSRILLAIKRALSGTGTAATYVFDEVDSGVGGAVADTVGTLLAQTAAHHQVISITHLPQVASFARHHLLVSKCERDGRTITEVKELSEAERIEEIARMLGGRAVTAKTRAHAAEMVRLACAP